MWPHAGGGAELCGGRNACASAPTPRRDQPDLRARKDPPRCSPWLAGAAACQSRSSRPLGGRPLARRVDQPGHDGEADEIGVKAPERAARAHRPRAAPCRDVRWPDPARRSGLTEGPPCRVDPCVVRTRRGPRSNMKMEHVGRPAQQAVREEAAAVDDEHPRHEDAVLHHMAVEGQTDVTRRSAMPMTWQFAANSARLRLGVVSGRRATVLEPIPCGSVPGCRKDGR